MVRKSGGAVGTRSSKRLNSNGPTQASFSLKPQQELQPKQQSHPDFPAEVPNQFGIDYCPECKNKFNVSKNRALQEGCGHVKCRDCLIKNEDGCVQCKHPPGSSFQSTQVEIPPTVEHSRVVSNNIPSNQPKPDLLWSTNVVTNLGDSTAFRNGPKNNRPLTIALHDVMPNPYGGSLPLNSSADIIHRQPPRLTRNKRKSQDSLPYNSQFEVKRVASGFEVSPQSKTNKESTQSTKTHTIAENQCRNNIKHVHEAATFTTIFKHDIPNLNIHIEPPRLSESGNVNRRKYRNKSDGPNSTYKSVKFLRESQINSICASATIVTLPENGGIGNNLQISQELGETLNTICPAQLQELQLPVPIVLPKQKQTEDVQNTNQLKIEEGDSSLQNSLVDENVSVSAPNSVGVGEKKKKKRSPVFIHDHITILGGEPPMYQCSICTKKFKTKAHIKYHEFCQNGEKPFRCEQCGQGFIAKSHYEYHLRTHTGERPYVCPKCGKGFNQRGKVTRHMRSHTGEKPFNCETCGRGFANAQAMRSHTLIHTGERPFACQHCSKRFTGMTNLKKHIITHTGERPFMCVHCGKSFGLKWTLDLHMRTHSSERPYACDQCSRAFSNSKDLRRHLVIHSGERPFKCWLCGTAFRRKDNLDRHIKNTHNQPKEVAKRLANQAAAEYLASTKAGANAESSDGATASTSTASSTISAATTNGNFRRQNTRKIRTKTKIVPSPSVIITAEVSPSSTPLHPPNSDNSDTYILPNNDYGSLITRSDSNDSLKLKAEISSIEKKLYQEEFIETNTEINNTIEAAEKIATDGDKTVEMQAVNGENTVETLAVEGKNTVEKVADDVELETPTAGDIGEEIDAAENMEPLRKEDDGINKFEPEKEKERKLLQNPEFSESIAKIEACTIETADLSKETQSSNIFDEEKIQFSPENAAEFTELIGPIDFPNEDKLLDIPSESLFGFDPVKHLMQTEVQQQICVEGNTKTEVYGALKSQNVERIPLEEPLKSDGLNKLKPENVEIINEEKAEERTELGEREGGKVEEEITNERKLDARTDEEISKQGNLLVVKEEIIQEEKEGKNLEKETAEVIEEGKVVEETTEAEIIEEKEAKEIAAAHVIVEEKIHEEMAGAGISEKEKLEEEIIQEEKEGKNLEKETAEVIEEGQVVEETTEAEIMVEKEAKEIAAAQVIVEEKIHEEMAGAAISEKEKLEEGTGETQVIRKEKVDKEMIEAEIIEEEKVDKEMTEAEIVDLEKVEEGTAEAQVKEEEKVHEEMTGVKIIKQKKVEDETAEIRLIEEETAETRLIEEKTAETRLIEEETPEIRLIEEETAETKEIEEEKVDQEMTETELIIEEKVEETTEAQVMVEKVEEEVSEDEIIEGPNVNGENTEEEMNFVNIPTAMISDPFGDNVNVLYAAAAASAEANNDSGIPRKVQLVFAEKVDKEMIEAEIIEEEKVDKEMTEAEIIDLEKVEEGTAEAQVKEEEKVHEEMTGVKIIKQEKVEDEIAETRLIEEETAETLLIEEETAETRLIEEETAETRLIEEETPETRLIEEETPETRLIEEETPETRLIGEETAETKEIEEEKVDQEMTETELIKEEKVDEETTETQVMVEKVEEEVSEAEIIEDPNVNGENTEEEMNFVNIPTAMISDPFGDNVTVLYAAAAASAEANDDSGIPRKVRLVFAEKVDKEMIEAEIIEEEKVDKEMTESEIIDLEKVEEGTAEAQVKEEEIVHEEMTGVKIIKQEKVEGETAETRLIEEETAETRLIEEETAEAKEIEEETKEIEEEKVDQEMTETELIKEEKVEEETTEAQVMVEKVEEEVSEAEIIEDPNVNGENTEEEMNFVNIPTAMISDPFGDNVTVLYAAAAASAEANDDSGIPRKVRLVFAEALGFSGAETGNPHFVYASAKPNQVVLNEPGQSIEVQCPTVMSTNGEPNRQFVCEQIIPTTAGLLPVHRMREVYSPQLPVHVENNNETFIASASTDDPENLALLNRVNESFLHLLPESYRYRNSNHSSYSVFSEPSNGMSTYQQSQLGPDNLPDSYSDGSTSSSPDYNNVSSNQIQNTANREAWPGTELITHRSANLNNQIPNPTTSCSDERLEVIARAIATVGKMAREREFGRRIAEEQEQNFATVSRRFASKSAETSVRQHSYSHDGQNGHHLGPRKHYLSNNQAFQPRKE